MDGLPGPRGGAGHSEDAAQGRGRASDTAVVGQAKMPVLLALEKAKRVLGRQGSSLANWAPSEQCGDCWPSWEGAQHMEVCKGFLEAFTEPFFLK